MKLISCESCGVVLDTDRIQEPNIHNAYLTGVDVLWIGGEFVSAICCPSCKTRIAYFSGEIS